MGLCIWGALWQKIVSISLTFYSVCFDTEKGETGDDQSQKPCGNCCLLPWAAKATGAPAQALLPLRVPRMPRSDIFLYFLFSSLCLLNQKVGPKDRVVSDLPLCPTAWHKTDTWLINRGLAN